MKTSFGKVAIGLVLVFFFLTGCSGKGRSGSASAAGSGGITLTFATSVYVEAPHRLAIDRLIETYNRQNPGVRIEVSGSGWENFWDNLTVAIIGGREADIVQVYPEHIARYNILRPGGAFVDLTDRVSATNFSQNLVGQEFCDINGRTTALSNYAWGTTGIFYRKSMLEAAGIDPGTVRTNDDFRNVSMQFVNRGTQAMGVVLGTHSFVVDEWSRFIARPVSFGLYFRGEVPPFTPENVNINSPENIWAAKWWQDRIVQDKMFNLVPDKRDSRELFWNGNVPFNLDGPWFIGMTAERDPTLLADVGLMPQFDLVYNGQTHVPNPALYPLVTMLSSNSPHKDEAWKFMAWMASDEAQEIISESGMIPSSRSFASTDSYRENNELGYRFLYFMENYYGPLVSNPPIPEMGEIEQVMIDAAQRMFSPTAANVEREMDAAHRRIQGIMRN